MGKRKYENVIKTNVGGTSLKGKREDDGSLEVESEGAKTKKKGSENPEETERKGKEGEHPHHGGVLLLAAYSNHSNKSDCVLYCVALISHHHLRTCLERLPAERHESGGGKG